MITILIKSALNFSHDILESITKKGDYVIDATMGNGHDTQFLSELVGETGKVFSFDIQKTALSNTKQLLKNHNNKNVELILDSHENFDNYIENNHITAII